VVDAAGSNVEHAIARRLLEEAVTRRVAVVREDLLDERDGECVVVAARETLFEILAQDVKLHRRRSLN